MLASLGVFPVLLLLLTAVFLGGVALDYVSERRAAEGLEEPV